MQVDVPIVNSTIILCNYYWAPFACNNMIINTQRAKNIFINCTNNVSCTNMAIHAEYAHKLGFFAWETNSGMNKHFWLCVCVFDCVFVFIYCRLQKIRKYKIKKKINI